jgi:hypothetical protein
VRTKALRRPARAAHIRNFFKPRWSAVRRISVDEIDTWLLGQFLVNYRQGFGGEFVSCAKKHHNSMFNYHHVASRNHD